MTVHICIIHYMMYLAFLLHLAHEHKTEDCPSLNTGALKDNSSKDKARKDKPRKDMAPLQSQLPKDKNPIQSQLPLVGDVRSMPSGKETETTSKRVNQKQVFADFKSNLHAGSSSEPRSPSVLKPVGFLRKSQKMGPLPVQSYPLRTTTTRMRKGINTYVWSLGGFINS
ncbi:hypothetical protein F2Q69_00055971 [Brassica cretica]|uniref:Uncharacterized protein n=1 Tax=Brassica cretica TaxID=69181 RepID=A0A8S9N436_BRACR|nr:hypothetical protein F2Q69_00055971 [Brassica cretica]